MVSGLVNTRSTGSRSGCTCPSAIEPAKSTSSRWGSTARSSRASWGPDISGMARSTMAKSHRRSGNSVSASSARGAVSTSPPARLRSRATPSRTSGSSSMTTMRGPPSERPEPATAVEGSRVTVAGTMAAKGSRMMKVALDGRGPLNREAVPRHPPPTVWRRGARIPCSPCPWS